MTLIILEHLKLYVLNATLCVVLRIQRLAVFNTLIFCGAL
jgi:hypothetical protein